jgi:hypothetical protein
MCFSAFVFVFNSYMQWPIPNLYTSSKKPRPQFITFILLIPNKIKTTCPSLAPLIPIKLEIVV